MSTGSDRKAVESNPASTRGIVLIVGPTASGKSTLALSLAESFGGVIINADSMQVYRELRILSARPTPADEARAPHRLYGAIPAAEACSAGRWRTLAMEQIDETREAGKVSIVVGGTGLYIRALTEGLAPIPEIPPEARAEAQRLYDRLGGERFRALLSERDPDGAARLDANDRQRLTRAWEVVEATGATLAEWQALPADAPVPPDRVLRLLVSPERRELYARCDARFRAMVEDGALEEVETLLALGLDAGLPAMKALGVRELARHLEGACSLDEAIASAQRATRRYAKRQLTWFRHQMTGMRAIDAQDSERITTEIFPFIRDFLLTAES